MSIHLSLKTCSCFESAYRKLRVHGVCLDAASSSQPPSVCVSVPLCCHSDAHLWQRSNSRAELVRADFTDSSAGGERFTLRASTLFSRGGQQHRDAPLDRGSVSVKSEKENETEKRAQRSGPVSTASTTTLRGGSGELGECKHTDALGYLLFF